ncbi:P-loop containing nucleoside triphosphate hydrolase protein [Daldinia sp. FL1419]|nr:P-loop containing nucleoside triphosphate hydrolase protein [Daldinia sp. FL1419]
MEAPRKSQQFLIPIAKSFSFAIPDKWKANPSIVRWIDNIPGPAKREERLTPARIQTPKRALETPDMDGSRKNDNHQAKRAKMTSSLSLRPTRNRRGSFATYSRGILRQASSAVRRVGSTARGSPSLPGSPATIVDRPRMRFVFVGDSGCGKSSLLLRYYRDTFNSTHIKTHYELFTKVTTVEGQEVELELWDTSGDITLHQLELLSYLAWDAVFLCFGMDDVERFMTVQRQWMDEINKHCGDIPFILLGLKKDKLTGANKKPPFHPILSDPVSVTKDSSGALITRGIKYMTCSAKTGENVSRVFEQVVRMVNYEREEQEGLTRLREKYGEPEPEDLGRKTCFK